MTLPRGKQGPQGTPGSAGKDGKQGPQGVPGAAATINVGTVTTGAPGSAATVINAGTENAAIFNFSIPQGKQGPQGVPGEGVETLYQHIKFYVSPEDDDPAAIFGGDWARIEGQFVFGCDTSHPSGDSGGKETVTLTTNQIPNHTHNTNVRLQWVDSPVSNSLTVSWASTSNLHVLGGNEGPFTSSVGGGQSHENMPPYLAMYMWYRIS